MEVACVFENVEFRVVFTRLFVTCGWVFFFWRVDARFAKKTGINGVFCENGKNDERQRVCLLHLGGSKFPENLRL